MTFDDIHPFYTFRPDETGLWITIDIFSVHVVRNYGALTIAIYETGKEDEEAISIATAYEED